MINNTRRERASLDNRLTPCAACDFPFTQKHHLLPFAEYGENPYTVQLCPNCHEVFHMIARLEGSKETPYGKNDAHILASYVRKYGWGDRAYLYLKQLYIESTDIQHAVDLRKITDEHPESRSEYDAEYDVYLQDWLNLNTETKTTSR